MLRVKSEAGLEMDAQEQNGSPSADDDDREEYPSDDAPILKKGPWTPAEDDILIEYVKKHGEGNWNAVQRNTSLLRCGKSCRLRWANHLRPDLRKGSFSAEEEKLIIELHSKIGNKWARMASLLPGRTDNEIKNFWNTRIKRCQRAGTPIYPFVLPHPMATEDQANAAVSSIQRQTNDFCRENGISIPTFTSENFMTTYSAELHMPSFIDDRYAAISYSPIDLTDIAKAFPDPDSYTSALNYSTSAVHSNEHFMHDPKVIIPCDPDIFCDNAVDLGDGIMGDRDLVNGNFSPQSPSSGLVTRELPSFQNTYNSFVDYSEAGLNTPPESPDYVQLEAIPLQQLECSLFRNSGLLELICQGCALGSTMCQPSVSSSISTAISSGIDTCPDYLEGESDPSAQTYLRDEWATPFDSHMVDNALPIEISPGLEGELVDSKYTHGGTFTFPECLRPDQLLGSGCLQKNFHSAEGQPYDDSAFEEFMGDYTHNSSNLMDCGWESMPQACELPGNP